MSKFALLFILTYFGGMIATVVVDTSWGFFLYQLVYFLYPENRWWARDIPNIPYSFIVVLFILITYIFSFKKYSSNKLFSIPQTKWLIFILVMFYVSYFFAVNQAYHEKALYEVTKLFVIIALGYKLVDSAKKLNISLWTYILGAAYIGLEAYRVGRDSQGRVEGIGTVTSLGANGIAAMLAPTIPPLIFYAWRGNAASKVFAMIFCAFIANGLVLLNSRGAFLGILIGSGFFIIYMLVSKFQQAKQKATAVFIVVVGIAGALYLTDATFWERMETLKDVQTDERESGSHRIHMWMSTFSMIADHPFGVGAAGFQKLSPLYVPDYLFFGGQATKAVHSSWFQSLAELGIPGPIFLIALILSCYRLTSRTKKYLLKQNDSYHYFLVVAIEGALLTFIITGSFIDEFRSEVYYWLIMFTACAGNIFLLNSDNSRKVAH